MNGKLTNSQAASLQYIADFCFHLQIYPKIHLQLAGDTHVASYKYETPFFSFFVSIFLPPF
jgi:hypothetical protein